MREFPSAVVFGLAHPSVDLVAFQDLSGWPCARPSLIRSGSSQDRGSSLVASGVRGFGACKLTVVDASAPRHSVLESDADFFGHCDQLFAPGETPGTCWGDGALSLHVKYAVGIPRWPVLLAYCHVKSRSSPVESKHLGQETKRAQKMNIKSPAFGWGSFRGL